MKKWRRIGLALLLAVLVGALIWGVGVRGEVQKLGEKAHLTEKDLPLALLSKGMLMRPVLGDFDSLKHLRVIPTVYHAQGVTLLIYAYDDVFWRRFGGPNFDAAAYERALDRPVWRVKYDAVKNLQLVYVLEDELAQASFLQMWEIFYNTLHVVRENMLQKEVDGVRLTIRQRYYCDTLRDQKNQMDLVEYKTDYQLTCQYIEPPLPVEETLELLVSVGGSLIGDEYVWDGQDAVTIRSTAAKALVEKAGAQPIYQITFVHGGRRLEVTIDQNDAL